MWIYKVFQKDMSTLLNVHQFCLYNYLTDNNMLGKHKFILSIYEARQFQYQIEYKHNLHITQLVQRQCST